MQNTKLTFTLTQPEVPAPDEEQGATPDEEQNTNTDTKEETTISTPDTGSFMGISSNAMPGVASVVLAILMCTAALVLAIRKYKKTYKLGLTSPLLIIMAILLGTAGTIVTKSFADTDPNLGDDTDYAVIEAPETITLTNEIDKEGNTFSTTKATITMVDATNYGYSLSIFADTNSLTPKTTGNETTITSIEEEGALTANTYGYTLEQNAKAEDEVWLPLSTIASLFYTTDSASTANTTTDIYFGILTDKDAEADTYELDVSFYGLAKAPSITELQYMQDFKTLTEDDKTAVLASMELNHQYQLEDSRDNKVYWIAKLADGNVWMTQNLDHDIVTTENFYTPANTDITANWTASTATRDTDTTTWGEENYTTPESYDPGELCWNGTITTTDSGATLANNARTCTEEDLANHRQIGNYYNWTAAVAMDDSGSYTENSEQKDTDQSICPAGWRLPTRAGNKSFQNLKDTLNFTSGTSGNIQSNPTYFVYGGYWYGGSSCVGYLGYYWSSVVADTESAYKLGFIADGRLNPQNYDSRDYGSSVRCLVR